MTLVHCYNLGCGNKFNPEDNTERAPIFHDAKKIWSCCSKYSTDFSDFLGLKGCTQGKHSNVKPVSNSIAKPIVENPPTKISDPKPVVEPKKVILDPTMKTIEPNVHPSLEKKIEEYKKSIDSQKNNCDVEDKIKIGTKCKNSGCKATFNGPSTDSEICLYHPGAAIFHEGSKYWTCCVKKTTDFETFLQQEGCSTGRHNWSLKDAENTNIMAKLSIQNPCKVDFFQISDTVTVQVFAKNILPETFQLEASSYVLSLSFSYDFGDSTFEKDFNLYGPIDQKESGVTLMSMKAEITLKKASPINWPKLEGKPV